MVDTIEAVGSCSPVAYRLGDKYIHVHMYMQVLLCTHNVSKNTTVTLILHCMRHFYLVCV